MAQPTGATQTCQPWRSERPEAAGKAAHQRRRWEAADPPRNRTQNSMQTMRRFRGLSASGSRENESGSKRVPHHGQFSSGIGEGLFLGSALNCMTLLRAESERPSPLRPK